jgi:hypothetical protein
MARVSLSLVTLQSSTWRDGHTRPGKSAAKRRNLTVELTKTSALVTFPTVPCYNTYVMFLGIHSAMGYRTFGALPLTCRANKNSPKSRGSELRPVYMGTWDRWSQWCNRLLRIIVIHQWPVFVWGKGERDGKGGDEARLAWEEVIRRQGAGRLFGYVWTYTRTPSPRK